MGPGIHPHTLLPRPQRSQPKPATTRTHKLARDNLYHPRGNTYFFKSQFLTTLPYPSGSYAGKNIIVTGSNTGLGLEAARHFVRLGCSRMILAVRNLEKGNQAKASIEHSTGCSEGIISVWELDLCSYSSVQSFASCVSAELERVDTLLLNAGVCALKGPWRIVEEDEEAITVNVVTTFLLAFLLFPKLRETSAFPGLHPRDSFSRVSVHPIGRKRCSTTTQINTSFPNFYRSSLSGRWRRSVLWRKRG